MTQSFEGYKRILLPIDFSAHCTLAAQQAAWLAKQSGGVLHLAHVVANPLDPLYEPGEVEHWVVIEHADQKARAMLEGIAATCVPPECPRQLHVLAGDPFARLMELAATLTADAIVLSPHGGGNLHHLLVGGLAEKIARHAGCAVLLVRIAR